MKKIFSILIIVIFLCQNVAFGTVESISILRPPLTTSKTATDWIEFQRNERTPAEIIAELDSSDGCFWRHLKDNTKSKEIMHKRLKFLLEEQNLPQLVKDKLKTLKQEGRIELSEDDIENCNIFIFGDALWYSESDKPNDIDMLIIVKGSPNFKGEKIWNLSDQLPHVAVSNIIGEEDLNSREGSIKNHALLKLSTGVSIYGKDRVRDFVFSPEDIIGWSSGLIDNGFGNDEFSMGDLGDSRKEWKRFFEAYLYMYSLFSDYMPEVIDEISDKFLEGLDLEAYLIRFYNGDIDRLPWDDINVRDDLFLYNFGTYLQENAGELKEVLNKLNLLQTKIVIKSGKDRVRLKVGRFPDREFDLRILNPGVIDGKSATITSSLENTDNLVMIVLLMDMLRMYGAKEIKLVLDKPHDIKNGLDKVLRYFCKGLAYRDGAEEIALDVDRPEPIKKEKTPLAVHRILYQRARLKNDAEKAVESITSTMLEATRLEIDKHTDNPLDWSVKVSEDVKGENVILLHSTESSNGIAELWLMLIALRRAGVRSISVINTFEGYSRQDKVFNVGEGISADTMLKLIHALVDNYITLNVHYADKSGKVRDKTGKIGWVNKYGIYNLNGFVQPAEKLFDEIAGWVGKDDLVKELEAHPLILVAPDDGAFGYVREAAEALKIYVKKKYGIDIEVHYGYMDKTRISDKEAEVAGIILGEDDKPISKVSNLKDSWVIVLDDETSWGTTLLAATYALRRDAGVPWLRILTGAVHGKLARGLKPFDAGYSEEEMLFAMKEGRDIEPRPEYIDEAKRQMPPRLFVTTESVALPDGFPEENRVSIEGIIKYAIQYIIGDKERKRGIPDGLEDAVRHRDNV